MMRFVRERCWRHKVGETPSELGSESREEESCQCCKTPRRPQFLLTFYPFYSCVSENRPSVDILHGLENAGCAITGAHVEHSRTNHPWTPRCRFEQGKRNLCA